MKMWSVLTGYPGTGLKVEENHENPVTVCNMVCSQSGYFTIIPLLIVNKIGNVIIR
jgi:hypothetical protein